LLNGGRRSRIGLGRRWRDLGTRARNKLVDAVREKAHALLDWAGESGNSLLWRSRFGVDNGSEDGCGSGWFGVVGDIGQSGSGRNRLANVALSLAHGVKSLGDGCRLEADLAVAVDHSSFDNRKELVVDAKLVTSVGNK
jgi:hypothetical protein